MASLIDSYSETNVDGTNNICNIVSCSNNAQGQSFTTLNDGYSYLLNSCKFHLSKLGSPTGNMIASVYAHSGTYGSSSIPTGDALAVSDAVNIAGLSTDPVLITFTFSGENIITLTPNIHYCVAVSYTGGNGSNLLKFGADSSSPSHGGNIITFNGSDWGYSTSDSAFYVYGDRIPINYTIEVSVGAFILTGINIIFSKGYNLITSVGAFILTGINIELLRPIINMAVSVGQFTLTGINITFTKGWTMAVSVGQFILTGKNIFFDIWKFLTKNTTSYTNQTKNTTNYTNQDKNTTSWTPQDKS